MMTPDNFVPMREVTSPSNGSSGFRILAVITSFLFLLLACVWMFAPAWSLARWGISSNEVAELVGRRAAAMYFAFAVMFFMARDLPPSPARRTLVSGFVVGCLILAVLGLFELHAGRAQIGILIAVAVEVALPLALSFVDRGPALSAAGN